MLQWNTGAAGRAVWPPDVAVWSNANARLSKHNPGKKLVFRLPVAKLRAYARVGM